MSEKRTEGQWADYHAGWNDALDFAIKVTSDLEGRWSGSAAEVRKDGSYTVRNWFFGKKVTRVLPKWEQVAAAVDAAAHGLRTICTILASRKRSDGSS
jgi:hypothetical protein